MKRTVIDGKVFIVRACKDCPYLAQGEGDYFCNHYNSEYREWYIFNTGKIDPDCPLEDYDGDCKEELEEPRKSELLPCPFCGAPAKIIEGTEKQYQGDWNVLCDNPGVCGIRTGWIRVTRERAIEMWNRRVNG